MISGETGSPASRSPLSAFFDMFARRIAVLSGRPAAFALALGIVLLWAVTGPLFGMSDTWQLVINTGTSLVTFLMVFVIQNAQNRDSEAIQIKLDELIRVSKDARNDVIGAENLEQKRIDRLRSDIETHATSLAATEET